MDARRPLSAIAVAKHDIGEADFSARLQGPIFAAQAAHVTLMAVLGNVAFGVALIIQWLTFKRAA